MGCTESSCVNCDRRLGYQANCCSHCGYITPRGKQHFDTEFVRRRQREAQLREHGIMGWLLAEGLITDEHVKKYNADTIAEALDKHLT